MPISQSAKKALRQSRKREIQNRAVKVKIKKQMKEILSSAKKKDPKLAILASNATSTIDKAVKGNIIHKNKAARLKSRISKVLSAAKIAPKPREKQKPAPAKKKATPKKSAPKKTQPKTAKKSVKPKKNKTSPKK